MTVFFWARFAGFFVTLSILIVLIRVQLREAEWAGVFRTILEQDSPSVEGAPRPNPFEVYVNRLKVYLKVLDKPHTNQVAVLRLLIFFAVLMVITAVLLHYEIFISIGLSTFASLAGLNIYYAGKARKRLQGILYYFLFEAVPIGLHSLQANNDLERTIWRMRESVSYKPLQMRMLRLENMCKLPQYATTEDAFDAWANDLAIPEIKAFAQATKQAKLKADRMLKRDELWSFMSELLGEDLQFLMAQRAETSAHRKGATVFFSLFALIFIGGFPFAGKYMNPTTKLVMWVVLGVMVLFLYIIHRESESVDV